jgi:hypothetical protein
MRKIFVQVVEDVDSNIFRGWIDGLESNMLVEIVVIEAVKDLFESLFEGPEINAHAEIVQTSCLNRNLNFPVVPMGPFAVARIIS